MPDAQNAFRKVSQNKRMDVVLNCLKRKNANTWQMLCTLIICMLFSFCLSVCRSVGRSFPSDCLPSLYIIKLIRWSVSLILLQTTILILLQCLQKYKQRTFCFIIVNWGVDLLHVNLTSVQRIYMSGYLTLLTLPWLSLVIQV